MGNRIKSNKGHTKPRVPRTSIKFSDPFLPDFPRIFKRLNMRNVSFRAADLVQVDFSEARMTKVSEDEFNVEIKQINDEYIRYIDKYPEMLYEVSPRKFEEIIAELLKDMGYDIQLTPQTKDGGRDILAVIKIPPGREILTIVECKRYKQENKIGLDLVRSFLWILNNEDKANGGLIATTSFFSKEVKKLKKENFWKLELADFDDLKGWLANYGKWSQEKDCEIWLPGKSKGER